MFRVLNRARVRLDAFICFFFPEEDGNSNHLSTIAEDHALDFLQVKGCQNAEIYFSVKI